MNLNYNYIFEAARKIHPEAELSIINDEIIWIKPDVPPVNNKELIRLASEIANKQEYKNFRKEKYPKLEEQLDMLWHSIDQGTLDKNSEFYKTIQEVKQEFPKP